MGHSGRGSSGGQAAATIHEEVRQDYIKADADLLSNQLNSQVIKWLVDYNFPGVKKYPKIWIRAEDRGEQKTLADRDAVLQKMGLSIPAAYIYDSYGVPKPLSDEDVLTPLPVGKGKEV